MHITKLAQLLVYIRYVYKENVEEELLFCHPLKDHTGRKDMYCKVNELLKIEGLEWKIGVDYAQMVQKQWWGIILVYMIFSSC